MYSTYVRGHILFARRTILQNVLRQRRCLSLTRITSTPKPTGPKLTTKVRNDPSFSRHSNPQVYLGAANTAKDLNQLLRNVPTSFPQIALVARSNAGKSSLINALLGDKVAIVSKTPGRTRLAHAFIGKGFVLIDLPGYGFAKGSGGGEAEKMSNVVAECALEREETDLVLHLLDARRGEHMPSDLLMKDALETQQVPYETVLTKMDCIKKQTDLDVLREKFPKGWFLSSSKGFGVADLRIHLRNLLLPPPDSTKHS